MRLFLIGILAVLLMSAAFASGPMPPNSYLQRPAHSHDALMNHVKSDPVVMDRYMRHFAMTRPEVIQYFQSLELTRIPDDMVFVVYNVPDSGVLRSRVLKFKKGTKIWVDKSGRPVLKEECGNPLTKGPVRPEAVSISQATETAAPPKEPTPEDVSATEVFATTEPAEPAVPQVVAEAVPPTEPSTPLVTQGESNIPVVSAPWWLGIPILGGALAIVPRDNGSNPTPPPPPPPPPVPEPSSYIALALGSGALIVSMARKRSNQ